MTLAEKFHQWLKTEPFSSKDRPTLREAQCEQIADEYAIEFALWVKNNTKILTRIPNYTDTEVLQIFKKEKGL